MLRPSESDSVARRKSAHADARHIQDVSRLADVAVGAPFCAHCRDPEAAPTLAGDRARGPDHLYLVCDRCGGRWQPQRPDIG